MTNTFDPENWTREVHIIGVGGIGSWLVVFLMHKGLLEIHVYDDDDVEMHNVGPQIWRESDAIGQVLKILALSMYAEREELRSLLVPHPIRIDESSQLELSGVVISCVDSMASRKAIWQHVKYNSDVELYVDGRIGGECFQAYTLNPSDPEQIERYESSLFSDEEADDDPCAVREDFDSAIALAAHIAHSLSLFAKVRPLSGMLDGNLAAIAVNGRQASVVRSLI